MTLAAEGSDVKGQTAEKVADSLGLEDKQKPGPPSVARLTLQQEKAAAWYNNEVTLLKAVARTGSPKMENTGQGRRRPPVHPRQFAKLPNPYHATPAWRRIDRQPKRNSTKLAERRTAIKT